MDSSEEEEAIRGYDLMDLKNIEAARRQARQSLEEYERLQGELRHRRNLAEQRREADFRRLSERYRAGEFAPGPVSPFGGGVPPQFRSEAEFQEWQRRAHTIPYYTAPETRAINAIVEAQIQQGHGYTDATGGRRGRNLNRDYNAGIRSTDVTDPAQFPMFDLSYIGERLNNDDY